LLANRPHYGTEFRIELIDATTDRPMGKGLLTTQGLLQQQRDYLIEEKRAPFLSFLRPIKFTDLRHLTIEFRGGLKNGFSTDFFSTSKKSSTTDEELRPGRQESPLSRFMRRQNCSPELLY
jgi:hypothetical protein